MILRNIPNFLTKDELDLAWTEIANNPKWQYSKRCSFDNSVTKNVWRYRVFSSYSGKILQSDPSTWFVNQPNWQSTVSPIWVTILDKVMQAYGPNFQIFNFVINGLTKGQDDVIHRDLEDDISSYESTVIYLNPTWEKSWGGPLLYYDTELNVTERILPEPGQLVGHNGSCLHQPLGPVVDDILRVSFACGGYFKND